MIERADRGPLTVDSCAEVSRTISAILDVEDPVKTAYVLEVSSPGIDRPLVRLADFDRFVGHIARVELAAPIEGRRRFHGRLLGTSGEHVRLVEDEAKGPVELPFGTIQSAKLVLTDELIAASQAGG
jgi:ribosome maturation factor RimP